MCKMPTMPNCSKPRMPITMKDRYAQMENKDKKAIAAYFSVEELDLELCIFSFGFDSGLRL
ncbi:hypothetical protein BpHYR1_031874 [Brachionus plicatilis]|uniref:Uncharacterized protein n=1 Tax=Brachionus plicatilis TaxID=10195 RepID=A0A3M7QUY2_BRAPC|nr:hypothetical protein BpHYR1_031874 [Brachionus plicatilis]